MLPSIAKILIALQCFTNAKCYADNFIQSTSDILQNILKGNHRLVLSDLPIKTRLTIDANSPEELMCVHNEPVRWIPKVEDNTVLDIHSYDFIEPDSTPIRHRSELSLKSIKNTLFVGKYYCVSAKIAGTIDIKVLDEYVTYIFVKDSNNPLVKPRKPERLVITANQFEPVVIPCKPTSPDVKVKLTRQNGEKIEESHTFEPEVGFTVSFKHINQSGPYICEVVDRKNHFLQFNVTVTANSLESYIYEPELSSDWNFRAYQGNNMTIYCSFTKQYKSQSGPGVIFHESKVGRFFLEIEFNGKIVETDENRIVTERQNENGDLLMVQNNLTIMNVIKSRDEGDYKCVVKDQFNNSNSITESLTFVAGADVSFDPQNPVIQTKTGKSQAKFIIHYDSVTKLTIQINNPKNEIVAVDHDIINREKYDVKITNDEIQLIIKHPNIDDFGDFSIVATSAGRNFPTSVRLIVMDKPTVNIEDTFIVDGHPIDMICKVKGYPAANISWGFIPCNNVSQWPTCGRPSSFNLLDYFYNEVNEIFDIAAEFISDSIQEAKITFTPTEPGHVVCSAKNEMGNSTAAGAVVVRDIKDSFTVFGIFNGHKIAEGDSVKIECAASLYNCTDEILWSKDGKEITNVSNDHPIQVETSTTKYSRRKTITWKNITKNDIGTYQCDVIGCNETTNNTVYSESVSITVHDPEPLQIFPSFNETTMTHAIGDNLTVTCTAIGLPTPTLIWYKNDDVFKIGQQINDTARQDIVMSADNSSITFYFLNVKDSGKYRCVAMNRLKSHQKEFDLIVKGSVSREVIIAIAAILSLFICTVIIFVVKVRRDRSQIAVMKASGLANFEDGDLDHINPGLNLNEQADLLPYNRYFEFPREKLKMGKQLGAGAFGIVVEATATGILLHEEETTVAVKMVKKQTDNNVIRALVSELKIMINIGQHLNVVNLLGAVTKNIAKRELLVIVEYCRFGSLQEFLVKNRHNFIDQIRNDAIDADLVNQSAFSNSTKMIQEPQEHSYVPTGEESQSLKNGDNLNPETKSICTSDLVCWSFQIARGMDYLSTKKVLHGDLAARNVLLCDNNVVKICDFGLAKNLYMAQNYIKKSETPLPFKWLALESMSNQTFSVHSDVWSFGVLMWEIFSLGKIPYTGIEANEALFNRILNGYRMERPEYATSDIYHIILNCWYKVPETRPLFAELENQLGELLHSSVKNHYVQLNQFYLKANIVNLTNKSENYSSKFSAPLSDAPSVAYCKKSSEGQVSMLDITQEDVQEKIPLRSHSDDNIRLTETSPRFHDHITKRITYHI